ncbi:hypothetical protein VTO42DRAFT_7227 [Malbranchea cinnamomea]
MQRGRREMRDSTVISEVKLPVKVKPLGSLAAKKSTEFLSTGTAGKMKENSKRGPGQRRPQTFPLSEKTGIDRWRAEAVVKSVLRIRSSG